MAKITVPYTSIENRGTKAFDSILYDVVTLNDTEAMKDYLISLVNNSNILNWYQDKEGRLHYEILCRDILGMTGSAIDLVDHSKDGSK